MTSATITAVGRAQSVLAHIKAHGKPAKVKGVLKGYFLGARLFPLAEMIARNNGVVLIYRGDCSELSGASVYSGYVYMHVPASTKDPITVEDDQYWSTEEAAEHLSRGLSPFNGGRYTGTKDDRAWTMAPI